MERMARDRRGLSSLLVVQVLTYPPDFIILIRLGNLPYTATTASISKHFASLKPASIRHITHKDQPSKSKGYAFLEFDGYDRMKTCLKLHHQSTFDDGLSAARKINVELTYFDS
jgi:nucleolar protein 6